MPGSRPIRASRHCILAAWRRGFGGPALSDYEQLGMILSLIIGSSRAERMTTYLLRVAPRLGDLWRQGIWTTAKARAHLTHYFLVLVDCRLLCPVAETDKCLVDGDVYNDFRPQLCRKQGTYLLLDSTLVPGQCRPMDAAEWRHEPCQ